MEDFFIRLVQIGFHGAAAAFLALGYRLRQPLLVPQKKPEKPMTETELQILKLQIGSAEKFLWLALMFLVVGCILEFGRLTMSFQYEKHPHEISFVLQPIDMPENTITPKLSIKGKKIAFEPESGLVATTLLHNESIQVIITPLTRKIRAQAKLIHDTQLLLDRNNPKETGVSGG